MRNSFGCWSERLSLSNTFQSDAQQLAMLMQCKLLSDAGMEPHPSLVQWSGQADVKVKIVI